MRFGGEEQKAYFLPRILSGEIDCAIGYSEPDAGTDLAALKTRAVREGKPMSSTARRSGPPTATRRLGLARGPHRPRAPPHQGITMLLVPASDPGYRSAVIFTVCGNNEIQREIIAWIGHGMPRVRR